MADGDTPATYGKGGKMALTDKRYKRFLLLILSGFLTGVGLVVSELGLLCWCSLVPLALILIELGGDRKTRLIEIFLYGLTFFFSMYIVTIHWFLYMYPLSFLGNITPEAALAIVLLAWIGLSLFNGIIGGAVVVVMASIRRAFPLRKLSVLTPIIMGAVWVCYEYFLTVDWWVMPTPRWRSPWEYRRHRFSDRISFPL